MIVSFQLETKSATSQDWHTVPLRRNKMGKIHSNQIALLRSGLSSSRAAGPLTALQSGTVRTRLFAWKVGRREPRPAPGNFDVCSRDGGAWKLLPTWFVAMLRRKKKVTSLACILWEASVSTDYSPRNWGRLSHLEMQILAFRVRLILPLFIKA